MKNKELSSTIGTLYFLDTILEDISFVVNSSGGQTWCSTNKSENMNDGSDRKN